jgi:hypothetical protein
VYVYVYVHVYVYVYGGSTERFAFAGGNLTASKPMI